jgi:putative ubiquitin-RnfH superfamily antitoxin RatB of RatAB toxin-antitoxin module
MIRSCHSHNQEQNVRNTARNERIQVLGDTIIETKEARKERAENTRKRIKNEPEIIEELIFFRGR